MIYGSWLVILNAKSWLYAVLEFWKKRTYDEWQDALCCLWIKIQRLLALRSTAPPLLWKRKLMELCWANTVRIHGVHQERIFGIYRRNRLDHDWCAGVEKSVRLFRSCIRFSTAVHLRIHLYVQACFLSLGKRQIILSLFLVVLKVSVAVNNICVAGCGSGWRSCSLMVLAA